MKSLILITLITTQYLFAIVSIAPVEIGEKAGLSATVETGLETKRGNTDKDSYKASVRVTYDEATDYVVWAELSGEYGKSNGVEDTNEAFAHLRYIHALTDDENLRYELFAQLESDKFRQINSRVLGGAGLRYRVFNSAQKGKGYFGFGAFHESIRYESPLIDPNEDNDRLNSYLAYSVDFGDSSKFSYSLYYQPKINNFGDYIQTNKLELKFKLYKELFLKFNASWNVDTKPPVGVEKSDFTQRTTFVFNF